jgi:uncharacterized protein (TIGR03083 family)
LTQVRVAFLDAAASVTELLGEQAVTASWRRPSALPEFSVGGLAAHLARQVLMAPAILAAPPPAEPPNTLLEHYSGVEWRGRPLHDEGNVRVRQRGEQDAADGPAALAARTEAAVSELRATVPAEPAGRVVYLPWGPWALSLDDFLITRMMEIAVHSDDLAVSVGVRAPALPPRVLDPVLALLTRLAVQRHGQSAVLSALSRAERAPVSIVAI